MTTHDVTALTALAMIEADRNRPMRQVWSLVSVDDLQIGTDPRLIESVVFTDLNVDGAEFVDFTIWSDRGRMVGVIVDGDATVKVQCRPFN